MRIAGTFLILSMLYMQPLSAAEVAGVILPDVITLDGQQLQLNGAGIRHKFFVKVYVGGLYIRDKTGDPAAVYKMPGPRRIVMHFLYDEVSREKLVNGWSDGFRNNQNDDVMAALRERLQAFNELFTTVHKGDVIRLDYLPGIGTQVWIRGEHAGTVEGADFNAALLAVWLGGDPADSGLKNSMLGGE